MNRKKYLTYLYYFISGIFLILFILIFNLFIVYFIVIAQDNPTINYAYIILFIGIIILVLFIIILGKKMIQWIIIDDTYITAKCLFGVIKRCRWDELEDVVFERFDVGSPGIKSGWFVFVEKGKRLFQRNGIITKNSYITLKYNKSTFNIIKQYWKKEIKNL